MVKNMTVIGFLACKMFHDEIIYLILNDPEIKDITIIENGEHNGLIQKLDDVGVSYSLQPTIHSVPDLSDRTDSGEVGISLIVWCLELALHDFPKKLKEEVYADLEILAKKVDGIYLLYGLCGNVLGHVEKDFKDICPVVILRDPDGEVVDDCIGAALGGRRQYLALLKKYSDVGTFFFTPMFAASIEEFFNYRRNQTKMTLEQNIEMNRFMFEASNYKRIARLETGLYYTKNADEVLNKFADMYNFEIFDIDGGHQEVFDVCYQKLKSQIAGSR
jgi:hypothetical protein